MSAELPSAPPSEPTLPAPTGWLANTCQWLWRQCWAWGQYVLAVAWAIGAVKGLREAITGELPDWAAPYAKEITWTLAIGPLGILAVCQCLHRCWRWWQGYQGRRFAHRIISGRATLGYFDLASREVGAECNGRLFPRPDRADVKVLDWYRQNDLSPVVYLTGLSGCGKSSLLTAAVIPQLEATPDVSVVRVRATRDLANELRICVRRFYERQPSEAALAAEDGYALLTRLANRKEVRRLVLVVDQFDEALLQWHLATRGDRCAEFPILHLLRELWRKPISGLTTLLVVRTDPGFGQLFNRFLEAAELPEPAGNNRRTVDLYDEDQAREFLVGSGLHFGPGLLDDVIIGLQEFGGQNPYYRPVALNMAGVVLARLALGDLPRVPCLRGGGGFLTAYVRDCLGQDELGGDGLRVVRQLLAPRDELQVRTIAEIAGESWLRPRDVRTYLGVLAQGGLVREVDAGRWQFSHVFVARVVGYVLGTWRSSIWNRVRQWAPRLALGAALAAVTILLHRPTPSWYEGLNDEQIRHVREDGSTVLHDAVGLRNPEKSIPYLVDRGADVNKADVYGMTPLRRAIGQKNSIAVNALLSKGARSDYTDLIWVIDRNDLASLKSLLDSGADPNNPPPGERSTDASSKQLMPPLIYAISNDRPESARLLIHAKADLHKVFGPESAFSVIVERGWLDLLRELLEQQPNLIHWQHPTLKLNLLHAVVEGAFREWPQGRPLPRNEEYERTIQLLVQKGADLEGRINYLTPLLLAAGIVAERDDTLLQTVVGALIGGGANVNAQTESGDTPLHRLLKSRNPRGRNRTAVDACINKLLDAGADPHMQNKFGKSPLDLAKAAKMDEIVARMVKVLPK